MKTKAMVKAKITFAVFSWESFVFLFLGKILLFLGKILLFLGKDFLGKISFFCSGSRAVRSSS